MYKAKILKSPEGYTAQLPNGVLYNLLPESYHLIPQAKVYFKKRLESNWRTDEIIESSANNFILKYNGIADIEHGDQLVRFKDNEEVFGQIEDRLKPIEIYSSVKAFRKDKINNLPYEGVISDINLNQNKPYTIIFNDGESIDYSIDELIFEEKSIFFIPLA